MKRNVTQNVFGNAGNPINWLWIMDILKRFRMLNRFGHTFTLKGVHVVPLLSQYCCAQTRYRRAKQADVGLPGFYFT